MQNLARLVRAKRRSEAVLEQARRAYDERYRADQLQQAAQGRDDGRGEVGVFEFLGVTDAAFDQCSDKSVSPSPVEGALAEDALVMMLGGRLNNDDGKGVAGRRLEGLTVELQGCFGTVFRYN